MFCSGVYGLSLYLERISLNATRRILVQRATDSFALLSIEKRLNEVKILAFYEHSSARYLVS